MIGMILSGHNHFASGLQSSLNLIAGDLANFAAIDFTCDLANEDLKAKMSTALDELQATCNHVIIFTDLQGGSPFQAAAMCAMERENISVLAGTNLPMLIEINGARAFMDDPEMLVNMAISTGKDQIAKLELSSIMASNEPSDDSDGI